MKKFLFGILIGIFMPFQVTEAFAAGHHTEQADLQRDCYFRKNEK